MSSRFQSDRATDPSPVSIAPQIDFRPAARERSIRSRTARSRNGFERACQSLAGGVSSGLRRQARPYPLYFDHGSGARVWDIDGNAYLDYGLAWGPLILGHCPAPVVEAVAGQLAQGFTFGAQHALEI